jgi:hypothetical protein
VRRSCRSRLGRLEGGCFAECFEVDTSAFAESSEDNRTATSRFVSGEETGRGGSGVEAEAGNLGQRSTYEMGEVRGHGESLLVAFGGWTHDIR